MYDIRGADGTGTSANPVSSTSANAKSYTIRKIADGNCWMTENLTLPLAAGTTVEASYNTSATPYSFTPTSCGSNGACSMNGNTKSGRGTYLYSWYAATAEINNSATNTDTTASICPVGWRLPANYTFDNAKSYSSITNSYGYTTNGANNGSNHVSGLESFPLNFARTGYYGTNCFDGQTTCGTYWSSSTSSSGSPFFFYYHTKYTYPQDTGNKYYATAVRCVAL